MNVPPPPPTTRTTTTTTRNQNSNSNGSAGELEVDDNDHRNDDPEVVQKRWMRMQNKRWIRKEELDVEEAETTMIDTLEHRQQIYAKTNNNNMATTTSRSVVEPRQQQQQQQKQLLQKPRLLSLRTTGTRTSFDPQHPENLPPHSSNGTTTLAGSGAPANRIRSMTVDNGRMGHRRSNSSSIVYNSNNNNNKQQHQFQPSQSGRFQDLIHRVQLIRQESIRHKIIDNDAEILLQTIQQQSESNNSTTAPPTMNIVDDNDDPANTSGSKTTPPRRSSKNDYNFLLRPSPRVIATKRYDRLHNPLYASVSGPMLSYDDKDETLTAVGDVDDEDLDEIDDDIEVHQDDQEKQPLQPQQSSLSTYGSVLAANVRHTIRKRKSWKHKVQMKFKRFISCDWIPHMNHFLYHTILCSYFGCIGLPLLVLSYILLYWCGNPICPFFKDIFPTQQITFSWWFNFVGRQTILLELSRMTQWFLLDCCILGSGTFFVFGGPKKHHSRGKNNNNSNNNRNKVAFLVGPYITLIAIQSKGVLFLLVSWSIYDLFLLRGTSSFHNHWLYFYYGETTLYGQDVSGADILSSSLYLRLLLAMLVVGCVTTIKRVVVDLTFGKRLLADFKPRMEMLLADIVLMNEISILAEHIDAICIANEEQQQQQSNDDDRIVSTEFDNYDNKEQDDRPDEDTLNMSSVSNKSTRSTSLSLSQRTISHTNVSSPVPAAAAVHHKIDSTDSNGIEREQIAWSDIPVLSSLQPSILGRSESTFTVDDSITMMMMQNSTATMSFDNHPKPSSLQVPPPPPQANRISYSNSVSSSGTNDNNKLRDTIAEPNIYYNNNQQNNTASSDLFGASRNNSNNNMSSSSAPPFITKDLLDQWEDPVKAGAVKATNTNNHGSKYYHDTTTTATTTIYDVLRFKRALGYMDEPHPFGIAFGYARNRDEALVSAHHVYYKLTKFDLNDGSNNNHNNPNPSRNEEVGHDTTTGTIPNLHFDILALIGTDENGKVIPEKIQALKKLFRPDSYSELSLIAFIQSCDTIYKRLRYLRASVYNTSAIDNVLENIINCMYWFVLCLVLMEIMNMNPWTIIVSTTSILVSISFALGPSVSQFVEGLLMIAIRRPYDLGDRILIADSQEHKPSLSPMTESYFVEDITLLKTTIRYARTNEVSTINNYSLSKSRIINLQRSSNAVVWIEMKCNTNILDLTIQEQYRTYLINYVNEHTRSWECLLFMRHDEFDTDYDCILYRFAFKHRYSWQNVPRILLNRSVLYKYMYEKGIELDIFYQTPMIMQRVYQGGIELEPNDIIGPRGHSYNTTITTNHQHDDDRPTLEIGNEDYF